MRVPTCAAAATLSLLSACGGATESPAAAIEVPSAERLHGEWRRDYITAGAVAMNSSLRFESDGSFTLDTRSMTSFTEPAAVSHYQGSYHGTARGTVQYEWEAEAARSQRENSLTFVEGRALDHRCCNRGTATDAWWTHRGYLATSPTLTTFHREAAERQFEADGTLKSSRETQVDLTFSETPALLVGRSDGELEVSVGISVVGTEGAESRSVRITLPCRVQADGDGMFVVLVPGWDSVEGHSLAEWSYRARGLWSALIAREVDTTDWSESARIALQGAFEPYIAFDEARQGVLFHYIERNSLDITGYARIGD